MDGYIKLVDVFSVVVLSFVGIVIFVGWVEMLIEVVVSL